MMKKHPEVFKKGKGIDMSDIERDPVVMFQKRFVTFLTKACNYRFSFEFDVLESSRS